MNSPVRLRVSISPLGLSSRQLLWKRRFFFGSSSVAFLAGLANCSWPVWNPGSINCSASIEPAVVVEIQDARTGVPLAEIARGVVRDGAYVDSLRPHGSSVTGVMGSRAAALERPGTYSVEVKAPGYQTWTLDGLVISRDECHVRTRRVRAGLKAMA